MEGLNKNLMTISIQTEIQNLGFPKRSARDLSQALAVSGQSASVDRASRTEDLKISVLPEPKFQILNHENYIDIVKFLMPQKEMKNIFISEQLLISTDSSFVTKKKPLSRKMFLIPQSGGASSFCVKVKPSIFFTNSGDDQRDTMREDRVERLFRGQLPRLDMNTINEENRNVSLL